MIGNVRGPLRFSCVWPPHATVNSLQLNQQMIKQGVCGSQYLIESRAALQKKKKLNKKFKNNSVTGNTPNWSYWKMWQAAEHSPCCHRLLFLSGVICEVTILVFSGKCQSALGFKHMMYTVSCWSSFCNTLAVLLLFLLPQEELWTLC